MNEIIIDMNFLIIGIGMFVSFGLGWIVGMTKPRKVGKDEIYYWDIKTKGIKNEWNVKKIRKDVQ